MKALESRMGHLKLANSMKIVEKDQEQKFTLKWHRYGSLLKLNTFKKVKGFTGWNEMKLPWKILCLLCTLFT